MKGLSAPARVFAALVRLFILAALAGTVLAAEPGQYRWIQQQPAHRPAPRSRPALAADPGADTVVLFGGYPKDPVVPAVLDDTWLWTGTDWVEQFPETSPSPRYRAEMAFDPLRGRVVLFGGRNTQQALDDTWEWDGTAWRQPNPADQPANDGVLSRFLSWSPRLGQVVLLQFIETEDEHLRIRTWGWDGTAWELIGLTEPFYAVERGLEVAFDSRGDIVWFGGSKTGAWVSYGLDLMYSWDGETMSRLDPVVRPLERFGHGMCASCRTGRTALFGGFQCSGHCEKHLTDTWFWDGEVWRRVHAQGPSFRSMFGLAGEGDGETLLLFGGYVGSDEVDETWILRRMGDFDRNGLVNAVDAAWLAFHVSGLVLPDSRRRLDAQAADLDGDGILTVVDRQALLSGLAENPVNRAGPARNE